MKVAKVPSQDDFIRSIQDTTIKGLIEYLEYRFEMAKNTKMTGGEYYQNGYLDGLRDAINILLKKSDV